MDHKTGAPVWTLGYRRDRPANSTRDPPPRHLRSLVARALRRCDRYLVFYSRATTLLGDLIMARADGSLRNLLVPLARTDVLVVDDSVMTPLSETERL